MSTKIKNILIDLMSAIQAGKIFTIKHPQFNEFVSRTFINLNPILREKTQEKVYSEIQTGHSSKADAFTQIGQLGALLRKGALLLELDYMEKAKGTGTPGRHVS